MAPTSNLTSNLTRRSFVSLTAASLMATRLPAAAASAGPLVYTGSTSTKRGEGIHVARWHRSSGTFSDVRLAFEAVSPAFLAVSHHRKAPLLFAGHQTGEKTGGLSGFRIDPSGNLTLINTVSEEGADFVHLALDHTEQCLITVNYAQGSILSSKIAADGHLSDWVTRFQLTGSGPNASRQAGPHAHGVAVSPDNRFVYITDLGTDRIFIYKLNTTTAELTPNDPPFFAAAAGSGPRHLHFHPNRRWAYTINELNSTITFLEWNAKTGALTSVANVPTLAPDGDIASNRAGELAFDRAGTFLYACNRGDASEQLMTYSVGPDGHLTLVARIQTPGKEARHFTASPDDGYLIVTEQFTNELVVFARDRKTGLITPTAARYPIDNVSCVLFA